MVDPKPSSSAPSLPSPPGGGRSVNYPYIPLSDAISRVNQFWTNAGKNSIAVPAAGHFWGYKEKSGLRSTVSALKQYGLIVDEGDGDKRQVRLTNQSLDLILETNDSPKRAAALRRAALAPKIYSEILARFPQGLPADPAIKSYLLRDRDFNRKAVDSFLVNLRANLKLANIDGSANMPRSEDADAGEQTRVKIGDHVQWEAGGVLQLVQPKKVIGISDGRKFVFVEGSPTGLPMEEVSVAEAPAGAKVRPSLPPAAPPTSGQPFAQDTYNLGAEGQVILQWPAKMSQASYDEFVEWLELQVRKIARLSGVTPKAKAPND